MSLSDAWRSSLSFSERLGAIVKMHVGSDGCTGLTQGLMQARTAEYKSANPDVAPAEASSRAKALEAAIFSHATETLDYQARCNDLLEDLRNDAKASADPTEGFGVENEEQHGTKSIGRYVNAVHFRDGLYSDIYKTSAPKENPDAFIGTRGAAVAVKVTYLIGMQPPHNSEREVRTLKKVKHANIVPLWESFREPGYSHLVLIFPFYPYDLDMILRQGYIAEAQGRGYLRDLLTALQFLHSLGIIHRDVKPSNILMKSLSGPAILADFGIVWSPGDPDSEPADQKICEIGTTSYRAPDVLFGRSNYDSSVDMWAAGCVAAQVVSSSSKPLFESGDLGSDLTLIQSIFKKLGTPTLDIWPDAASCPDWGKIRWVEYPPQPWSDLLPDASDAARELVSQLIQYQGSTRLTAEDALRHPFFLNN